MITVLEVPRVSAQMPIKQYSCSQSFLPLSCFRGGSPILKYSTAIYFYTTSPSLDTALADLYACHSASELWKNLHKEIGYHSIRKGLTPSPCH